MSDFIASEVDKVSGFTKFIRKTHREMSEGERELPPEPGLIAQYALMLNAEDLERFVSHDYARTCLLIRTKKSGSREMMIGIMPRIVVSAVITMGRMRAWQATMIAE